MRNRIHYPDVVIPDKPIFPVTSATEPLKLTRRRKKVALKQGERESDVPVSDSWCVKDGFAKIPKVSSIHLLPDQAPRPPRNYSTHCPPLWDIRKQSGIDSWMPAIKVNLQKPVGGEGLHPGKLRAWLDLSRRWNRHACMTTRSHESPSPGRMLWLDRTPPIAPPWVWPLPYLPSHLDLTCDPSSHVTIWPSGILHGAPGQAPGIFLLFSRSSHPTWLSFTPWPETFSVCFRRSKYSYRQFNGEGTSRKGLALGGRRRALCATVTL